LRELQIRLLKHEILCLHGVSKAGLVVWSVRVVIIRGNYEEGFKIYRTAKAMCMLSVE
jgi:hypothetical protein